MNNSSDVDLGIATKDDAAMKYNRSLSKTHTDAFRQAYRHISMFS